MRDSSGTPQRSGRDAGYRLDRPGATVIHAALFLAVLGSTVAEGQMLLRLRDSVPGASESRTVRRPPALAAPAVTATHEVTVDLALLRAGLPRLELATPDGRVLVAERTLFRNRGQGNVLWVGRAAGATHDTVVLTLHDGHLAGTYGQPGRPKVDLTSTGEAGLMSQISPELTLDLQRECGAKEPDTSPPAVRTSPSTSASDRPDLPAAPPSTHKQPQTPNHQLDVLVLYTQDASNAWDVSEAAAIQAAVDYVNAVYQNGDIPLTLRLAHAAAAPAAISTAARRGRDWLDPVSENAQINRLRQKHEADMVMLFMSDGSDWARCGAAYLRTRDSTAATMSPWAFGFANLSCHSSRRSANSIFAHEIGHVLGGNHDPEGGGTATPDEAVYPYAYGHTDTAPDPDVATIMSYGTNNSIREAYFSTVRVTPNNWNIGIANERENERALKQTVASATEMNQYLPPAPPSGLTGTASPSGATVEIGLTWTDNSSIEESFEVQYKTWLESWSTDTKVGATLAADTTSTALTGLAPATRFVFRVAARNTHGANLSDVWSVRTPGTGPPTAPDNLTGLALDSNRIQLSWRDNAVVETGYEVQYRTTGSSTWTLLSTTNADVEHWTVTGLTAATSHDFRVGAKSNDGMAFSAPVTVSTLAPAAPSSLKATASDSTTIELTWIDNSSDETGFLIQYRVSGTQNWTDHAPEAPVNATSATVTGLTAGASYDFRVLAKNGAARSPPSNVASTGQIGAPEAPSGLSSTSASSTSAGLSWTDNSSDEEGFDVEYRTSGGGAWTAAATTAPGWTTWLVGNLTPSTDYDFRVVARNATGSAASNVAARRTGPAAPSNLTARRSGGTWRLAWDDNSDDEVEFDVYYQVTGDDDDDTWGYLKSPPRDSQATDTELSGQNYFFVVYAYISSTASSSPSNIVAVGAWPRPALPQNVLAVGSDSTSAAVTWADNSTDEGGFRVEHRRRLAGQTPSQWIASEVAADTTSTTVTGLTASGTYEFRVTSFYQASDTGSSTLSRSNTFITRLPPAAPSQLSISASTSTTASLSWTDNSPDETGFRIEYSESGAPGWPSSSTTLADATSATVTGLTAGTDHVFRVLATNANGDSTPSNVVATAAPGPPAAPSGLTVTPTGSTSTTVNWTDNSHDETGFDVLYRTLSTGWSTLTAAMNATSVAVTGLMASTTYEFRVTARNDHGSTAGATVSRTMPPAAPSGLAAVLASPTSVMLSWIDNSPDETSFVIQYRLSTATAWTTYVAEPAADALSATVAGLSADAGYDFRVLARHASNGLSTPSATVTIVTPAPPAAPSGLSSTSANSSSVGLSWTDNSSDEAGFDVEYRTGGGAWVTAATTEADWTAWLVGDLTPSTDYDFRVAARNASGSAVSNATSRKTGPPPPSNLTARRSSGTWRLQWQDNSNDEAEFDVYYQTTGDAAADNWSYLMSPSPNTQSVDTGLSGPNYFFTMFAFVNSRRASGPSNIVTVGTFPRPAIPQNLVAVGADSTNAEVAWTDNSANEGGFRVEHRTLAADGTSGAWTESIVDADSTSATVAGLTPSATYEFRVTSFLLASDTDSTRLSPGGAFIARMPPAAPTDLAVAAQSTTATLTWTDSSSHETAFRIEYRARGTSLWSSSLTVPANTTSTSVDGLTPGTDYDFRVLATNANGDSTPSNVASTAPPSLTVGGLANGTVAENAAYTSAKPTTTGHRGAVTWTKSGSDAADFTINPGAGVLSMIARDHEDPADADTDNVYEVTVTATDEDGITGSVSITVTVTNVNEAPTFAAPSTLALSVAEGATGNIGSPVTASDPEGATLTYSLTGADASAFQISATGQISLASGTVLNHEQKSSYSFNVVVSDGATPPLTATRAVTLTVTDVDESITIGGLANGTVAENAAYTSATPTTTGHRGAVTWTKSGSDAADFTINPGAGVLSMIARDHEDPDDANGDNVYEVTVTATDEDGITGSVSITVTVTNVNEAPTFAAPSTLALSVAEGATGNIGSPVTASDPEGATLTYSLTGTDAAAFQISATGQISLASGTVLNHEQKSSYSFNVVVSDGATPPLTATRAVTLTVTDVDESITIGGLANGTVAENAAYTSATPTTTGHRGAVTWTKSGSDAADFTINPGAGVLSMIARDHEDPADADTDNVYEVTVTATDEDGITGSVSITVTVTNVNEAPTFAAPSTLALSVAEGATGNIGSPVTASDPEGATLTYSLTGADASAFQISATGQISLASGTVLNHEQKSSYSFNVVVSDGATPPLTATRAVTLTVTDVDESITIGGLANGTVAENAAYTSATPTTTGHRGAVTWTKSGSDAADFTINPGAGVLSMIARDHEDPDDANGDNVYEVTVTATDEDGITGSVSITLTVTDVDETTETEGPDEPPKPPTPRPPANRAPEYPSSAPLAFLVPEGVAGDVGSPVAAVDPDGDDLTYTLAGPDAAFFAIDPTTAQLSIQPATTLDRWAPESYGFSVVASDGALAASRYVVVTVVESEAGAPDNAPPAEPPAAPANLTATVLTADAVLLTWEDEASDEAGFLILQRANDEAWKALRSVPADTRSATIEGLDQATRYEFLVVSASAAGSSASDMAGVTLTLAPPTHLDGRILAPDAVRLTWRDNSVDETGFDVDYRLAADEEWSDGPRLGANRTSTSLTGLTGGNRYKVRVAARGPDGTAYSQAGTFVLREPPEPGTATDCAPVDIVAVMRGDYEIRMCFETPSGTSMDASNYHLESGTSGLLYFFDRDNVEVLVKVLDGCGINGHRWVFIAPVTDLAFNLHIVERSTGRRFEHRNPKSRTARTRADTAAFPCRREASARLTASGAATGRVHDPALVDATPPAGLAAPDAGLDAGSAGPRASTADPPTACEPTGPGLELDGGYRLDMCFTTPGGLVQSALDWGLHGNSSALLYFFDRGNAEVLVKLLDGCAINNHRWVFSAPATDLEFNLTITAPDGERWVHRNTGGRTALPRADTAAFPCR